MRRKKREYLKKQQEYIDSLTEEQKILYEKRKKEKALSQARTDIVIKLFGIAVVFMVIFTFFIGITTVEGEDMAPALHDGDTVVYLKVGTLMNSNVVVYEVENDDTKKTGRVIASEGAVISKNNGGKLLIDGNMQPEQKEQGLFYETTVGESFKPVKVKAKQRFILGDKRDTARDSREYGLISDDDIKGKVIMIIRRSLI